MRQSKTRKDTQLKRHAVSSRVDPSKKHFIDSRIAFWNRRADRETEPASSWTPRGVYHRILKEVYSFCVPEMSRVLEVGCGNAELLASVEPGYGVGIDFSPEMVKLAGKLHPHIHVIEGDASEVRLDEKFDAIILSDLVHDLWDIQTLLEKTRTWCTSDTRVFLNFYSRLWQGPLWIAKKLGLGGSVLDQNWVAEEDVKNLLALAGFEIVESWGEVLFPFPIPLLERFLNSYVVRLWPFNRLALTRFVCARVRTESGKPKVSVIVPARNEAGNIADIFERTPEMGKGTELIFVEGHSKDKTLAEIKKQMALHPERECKLFQQKGEGKGDAVRTGFAAATGDLLMILDADLTVCPEDLPRFCDAITSGKGEFINGVRLVYPMERHAMQFLNMIANKLFGITFSWLLGQPVKDTLCGTKVLWKRHYDTIVKNRSYFGDFDPFGDFDLMFGAAKMKLRILDMPIRYRERVYGSTNIRRWKHGWLLIQMAIFAAKRLKFRVD